MPGDQMQPDVTEMIAVHKVFRDTLGASGKLIEQDGNDDTIQSLYANMLAFLRVHHDGEDHLVFPLLLERCAADRKLVEEVAGQHHDIVGLIAETEDALRRWAANERGAEDDARRLLAELDVELTKHFDAEETQLLDLCAANMSLEEWGALPGHAMANFDGDKIWLVLGLIRERMNQSQRDDMLAHMPPPAREMWESFGSEAFTDYMARVGAPLA